MTTLSVKRILVPTDFSECARAAFAPARMLAEMTGAEIVLLHIVGLPHYQGAGHGLVIIPSHEQHERLRKSAREGLDRLVGEAFPSVTVRRVVACGAPAEEIVEQARSEKADLIVMSTRGRTGLRRWLIGSVAERVVRAAECPVLTVKPDVPASAAPATADSGAGRALAHESADA